MLRGLLTEEYEWDQILQRMRVIYNNTLHSQTERSPADSLLVDSNKIGGTLPVLAVERSLLREGHPKFQSFKVNQLVVRKIISQDKSNVRKFTQRFTGPYSVSKVFDNGVAYEVVLLSDDSKRFRVHHDI
ncbi:UNVERIFIED_CONTAM: hypothetical protein RMT77_006317 [Armadillidium vulgare]